MVTLTVRTIFPHTTKYIIACAFLVFFDFFAGAGEESSVLAFLLPPNVSPKSLRVCFSSFFVAIHRCLACESSSIYRTRSGMMLIIFDQPLFELSSLSSHCLKWKPIVLKKRVLFILCFYYDVVGVFFVIYFDELCQQFCFVQKHIV